MKKRFLTFILSITAVVSCAFAFSACSPEEHEHFYTRAITKNATCMEKGEWTYTCACGDSYTEEISATGVHIWGEGEVTTEPTCTEEGVKTFTCTICQTATKTETVDKLPHEYGTQWESNAIHHWRDCATCDDVKDRAEHTDDGSGKCSVCDYSIAPTEGVVYEVTDGEASVVGYEGTATDVRIASTYNGVPVTSIGDFAFSHCTSLTSLVIGGNVTSIGYGAFVYCTSLTSVVILDSVTSIGDRAFTGCTSLTSIKVSENNTVYQSIDGNLYSKDGKILIQYAIGKTATSFTIPDSVTSIGDWAFSSCYSLTSVEIGDSVTTIGSSAFSGCYKLVEVVNKSAHITVTKGDSSNGRVGYYALAVYNSGDVFTSKLSNDNGYIIYTDGTEKILVGYNGTETDLVLPSYITKINQSAFYGCTSLTSVEIPDSVTTIGSSAFEYCYSLTSVEIGDSVTTIGDEAFGGCDKLVEVVNKSAHITVTKGDWSNGCVGYYALAVYNSGDVFTSKLSNDNGYIIYTDGTEKILVGYNGTETDLVLPSYITKIYQYAFERCDSLTSVVIGGGVTSIGDYAFYYCASLTSVEIPDSVTTIGDYAFSGCSSLTSITIPDSVTSIGSYAFRNCRSLTSVEIPDSVTTIGDSAFEDCSSLTSVVIPDGVTSIGSHAFSGCSSLTSIVIPDGVTRIGYSAFSNCSSLTSVVIPDSVTSIVDFAFSSCHSLTSVVIGDGVTSIGHYAFSNCTSLTSVVIGGSVTTIGDWAFFSCGSLTSIKYRGTQAEWNAILKASNWDEKTDYYTITYNYQG